MGKDDLIKEISSSVNLKLAINFMHSSKPAKTVYSPPNGFLRKYKSNLKEDIIFQMSGYGVGFYN